MQQTMFMAMTFLLNYYCSFDVHILSLRIVAHTVRISNIFGEEKSLYMKIVILTPDNK